MPSPVTDFVIQGKVGSRQNHKDKNNQLNQRIIIMHKAVIIGRKACCRYRRHSMVDRVKQIHAANKKQKRFRQRQRRINHKEYLRSGTQSRQQAVFIKSRRFRYKKMKGTAGHTWQQRDKNYDDTQTTQPVGNTTPE